MKGISSLIVLATLFLVVTLVINGVFLINILSREENLARTVREMYIYRAINYIETFKRTFPFLIEYPIYNTLSHNGGELCSFGNSRFITLEEAQEFLSRNRIISVGNVPSDSLNSVVYWLRLYFDNYHYYLRRIVSLTDVESLIKKINFDFRQAVVDICPSDDFEGAKKYYCSKLNAEYNPSKNLCFCQGGLGIIYENQCLSLKDACIKSGGSYDENAKKCVCNNIAIDEPCNPKNCGNLVNVGKFNCVDRNTLCKLKIEDEISITSENFIASYLPNNLGILSDILNSTVKVIMNFVQLADRADEEWLNEEKCQERDNTVKSIAEGFSCSESESFGGFPTLESCQQACLYKDEQHCSSTLSNSIISALGVGEKNVNQVKGREVAIKEYSSATVSTNYQFGYCVPLGCRCVKEECEKDDSGNCICEETDDNTGMCVKFKKKCVEWAKDLQCSYTNWRAQAGVSVTEKDERNYYPAPNNWKQSEFSFSMSLGHIDLGGRKTMDTCAVEKEIEKKREKECVDSGGNWNSERKECEGCIEGRVSYNGKCTPVEIVCQETGGTYKPENTENPCSCPESKVVINRFYCVDKKDICEYENPEIGVVRGRYNAQTNECECPEGSIDAGNYCLDKTKACQISGGTYNPQNTEKPCECDPDKDLISVGSACISKKDACNYTDEKNNIVAGTYDEVNRRCVCPEGYELNKEYGVCLKIEGVIVCSVYLNLVTKEQFLVCG